MDSTLLTLYLQLWDDLGAAVHFLGRIPNMSREELDQNIAFRNLSKHGFKISGFAPQNVSEPVNESIILLTKIQARSLISRQSIDKITDELNNNVEWVEEIQTKEQREEYQAVIGFQDQSVESRARAEWEQRKKGIEALLDIPKFNISRLNKLLFKEKIGLLLNLTQDIECWQKTYTRALISIREHLGVPPLDEDRFNKFIDRIGKSVIHDLKSLYEKLNSENKSNDEN